MLSLDLVPICLSIAGTTKMKEFPINATAKEKSAVSSEPWSQSATEATARSLQYIGWAMPNTRDLLLAVILAAFAASGSYILSGRIDRVIFEQRALDIWFDGDIPKVFDDMNYRDNQSYMTLRHPVLPFIEYPPVYILKKLFAVDPVTAVRITIGGVAFLWFGTFFVILRLTGCRRPDALLFSLLALTSASAMFWMVVPESFLFGSASILPALVIVVVNQHRAVSMSWYVISSAASLAVTVTNWMFGILATIVYQPSRRWGQITISAFSLVVLVWVIQKKLFPASEFFVLSDASLPETESGGPLRVLTSFLFHTIVMPALKTTHWWPRHPDLAVMTVQPSWPGSASGWGVIAVIGWFGLLGLGLWGLWIKKESGKLCAFLPLSLLGQLSLYLLFGRETFVHSLHFMPLLVILTALSTFTPARITGLVLTGVVTVCGGINNYTQFTKALEFVRNEDDESYKLSIAIRERPADSWPRGSTDLEIDPKSGTIRRENSNLRPRSIGHTVLAWPGSKEVDKAYHEPGGSFSPSAGSFGVSIWITDSEGNIKTTSDNIPVGLFREQFVWDQSNRFPPALLTESLYYRAQWSSPAPGAWMLTLDTQPQPEIKTTVVVRSVGSAGGPVRSLEVRDGRLDVNHRWTVTTDPKPAGVYLGTEGQEGWMTGRPDVRTWADEQGWGYAKIELAGDQQYHLLIHDSNQAPITNTELAGSASALKVDLPDDRFAACLRAQAAHLMMGLVDREARPADPMSYPFPWLRDEAYIMVALARAGEVASAKQLAQQLAEHDFFGGYGAEADAPGLAVWALTELATQIKDPVYDRWLWPHVQRKAETILAMLSKEYSIHKSLTTPVIPLYTKPLPSADPDVTLVSEPSRDGLIRGRIDNERPVLYVSAISHLGLMKAASLADRVDQPVLAKEWRVRADQVKQAWNLNLGKIPFEAFTYSHSMWPAWAANPKSVQLLSVLDAYWAEYTRNGFWQVARRSALKAAEAHEWLFLGREDRAWTVLTAFWDHQESSGLYTWRTESTPENTFEHWKNVRGWLKGQEAVTPYYTASAEILLLQLDMLAYSDPAASEPTLVIGGGIQPWWLKRRMQVRGISTVFGSVDWSWDGRELNVRIRGDHVSVRPGPAFKQNVPVHVEYIGS
jgi:hypothetical protein